MNFLAISLLVGGLVLGTLKARYLIKIDKKEGSLRPWELDVVEFWNNIVTYLIAGLIAYYFTIYRWPKLTHGENLVLSDFVLFLFFSLAIFGHLNTLSHNITKGAETILARFLGEKLREKIS